MLLRACCVGLLLFLAATAGAGNEATASGPAENYKTYCALCHGDDRQGYVNDHAPSLVSESLFVYGPIVPFNSIAYGRPGTPMGPYLDEIGGPMTMQEIRELAGWLAVSAGIEPSAPNRDHLKPVEGDIELGQRIYAENCAECHGAKGEGGEGTALGNATMLATTPDGFLKAAIERGREGTKMKSFAGILSGDEINSVVAFLRSRASGWDVEDMRFDEPPALKDIVVNPDGDAPEFDLVDDRYVMAEDLNAALEDGRRMILIDTRVPYFWAMAHIKGSFPIPYYSSGREIIAALPKDGTWIVAYCECPRAAADSTVARLRELGYHNTAVLYEGYAGWSALGYPVSVGRIDPNKGMFRHPSPEKHTH